MSQEERLGRAGPTAWELSPDREEVFEVWLVRREGGQMDGFVRHINSGRRRPVADWEDVRLMVNRVLRGEEEALDLPGE